MNKNNNDQDLDGTDAALDEVSTDAFVDPVLAQYQTAEEQQDLLKKLDAAKQERKQTDINAIQAAKRYRDERKDEHKSDWHYNLFFEVADTKLAALYSNLPKSTVDRFFSDADDHEGRVGGIILERSIEVENETGAFNGELTNIIKDFVIPGFGVGWVRLDEDSHMEPQPDIQPPPIPQAPLIHPETGAQLELPPIPQPSIPQPDKKVTTRQEACVDHVPWDDFFWAPSKTWALCSWVARRSALTRQDVEARFGHTCPKEMLDMLDYDKRAGVDAEKGLLPQHQTEETIDVYELWDKTRKLVFWFTKDADKPLDVREDDNQFEGFFPTPLPPLGRFDTSNTQPISDYSLVKNKYNELDALNMRCVSLSKALGVRFVYDASNKQLKDLYTTALENQGVPVENWNTFMEKGGLAGGINFAPLDEIQAAFAGASAELDRLKQQIYDLEGMSDILRGIATPYETATATTAKMAASFGRFATKQSDVAKYIAKLMKLKAHLMCKFYEPQFLLARIGSLCPADQQYIPGALQLLKDDLMRSYRLNVSTDSLQLPAWNQEKAERSSAIQAITGLLGQVMPGLQQVPELAPAAVAIMKWGVAGFKGSEEIQGVLDTSLDQLMAKQAQSQGQPQQPSPEQLKLQAAQMQAQTTMQVAQMKTQNEQVMQQRDQAFQASMAQQDNALKSKQQQIDLVDAQIRAAHLQHQVQDDANTHAHTVAIDIANASKPTGGQ